MRPIGKGSNFDDAHIYEERRTYPRVSPVYKIHNLFVALREKGDIHACTVFSGAKNKI